MLDGVGYVLCYVSFYVGSKVVGWVLVCCFWYYVVFWFMIMFVFLIFFFVFVVIDFLVGFGLFVLFNFVYVVEFCFEIVESVFFILLFICSVWCCSVILGLFVGEFCE